MLDVLMYALPRVYPSSPLHCNHLRPMLPMTPRAPALAVVMHADIVQLAVPACHAASMPAAQGLNVARDQVARRLAQKHLATCRVLLSGD